MAQAEKSSNRLKCIWNFPGILGYENTATCWVLLGAADNLIWKAEPVGEVRAPSFQDKHQQRNSTFLVFGFVLLAGPVSRGSPAALWPAYTRRILHNKKALHINKILLHIPALQFLLCTANI